VRFHEDYEKEDAIAKAAQKKSEQKISFLKKLRERSCEV